MTGAIDVVVDRADDLATTRALQHLAAREPTVLAVSIAPDCRDTPAAIWAILRALGKRIEHLDPATLTWHDTRRWLAAHQITELVILRAQHLTERTIQQLKWHLVTLAAITVTLLYSGDRATPPRRTTTLTNLLARRRPPAPTRPGQAEWPDVPRSHALRLRYDCWLGLDPQRFERVDVLLAAACRTLGGWLHAHPHATSQQLQAAISVLSAAPDPDQAYIRRSGAAIALTRAGLAIPPTATLSLKPRALPAAQIREALAHSDRAVAGHLLAELITGLPLDLLKLVRGDQITDDAILGCPVPEPARPVLRALDHSCLPVLHRPTPTKAPAAPPQRMANRPLPPNAAAADALATANQLLLHGRGESIPARGLTPAVRVQLDELVAEEVLELERGVYRASDIALYSCYELRFAPIRATDIQARRPADISREFR